MVVSVTSVESACWKYTGTPELALPATVTVMVTRPIGAASGAASITWLSTSASMAASICWPIGVPLLHDRAQATTRQVARTTSRFYCAGTLQIVYVPPR